MSGLLLGIDVGTYSSKGVLVDRAGSVLATHVVEHGLDVPHPGWAEQDADGVWWSDVVAIARALLDGQPYSGQDVAGVAISAIGPCLLPLDADGKPLRKAILYGVDARASEEIEILNRQFGEEAIFAFSGMALTSQAVGPKILWLKRHEPDVWRKAARFTTASSYLTYRLTGEHVMDRHTASHYMPMMDIGALEWSDRFAGDFVELGQLPRLGWSDEVAGHVDERGARDTGLRVGTPVAVGAVDALSEAISVGVVEPGDLMIMYGSTTFFILVLDEPVPDRRTWTVAGAFPGQFDLAAGMATTGALTRWFRDELAKELSAADAYDTLFREADRVPAGADGLVMLPYFSGERTPINDPHARGVLAGLSLAHTRAHVYRAVLEGVAFGIRHNLETFANMGAPVKRVVAVGGGTKSATWLQIVSDVTGARQILPAQTIGASFGDAFLAGLAAGVLDRTDLGSWVQAQSEVVPAAAHRSVYDDRYADYRALYEGTRGVVHSLGRAP